MRFARVARNVHTVYTLMPIRFIAFCSKRIKDRQIQNFKN